MHTVHIIFPSEYPLSFSYLKNSEDIVIYDIEAEHAQNLVAQAEIIFCLDFNDLDRIDKLGVSVAENIKAKKILIDHHLFPGNFPDLCFHDVESSSTCELVFEVIEKMGYLSKIDPMIGEALFTGIITDTGSFKYSTRAQTYEIASKLKSIGVDDYFLQDKIFNSLTHKQLSLLGYCLYKRMKVIEDTNGAYIYLTKEDYKRYAIGRGDTEGIVNYLLMMPNIKIAALISEQPSIIKISLRSKGDINVQEMATKYFNGGGHKNASGGGIYGKLDDIIDRFEQEVKRLNK